ncbi:MAG: GntR family transcriptional regulator [Holophaga sp.]|nr:GntR family transcriptional regulator [Holophaga sp.]
MSTPESIKEPPTLLALPHLGASHQPLRQVVTDALRKAILSKRLKPGERLIEEQLAADLGVSRNPVREALRMLESEGLVEISPRRGASVTNLSEDEAQEIVEVRAALEGLCARLAARRCSPALKADIQKILDRGERAAAANDSPALAVIHSQVHALMAGAGHNRHLTGFVQSLRDKTDWLYTSSVTWRAQQSWREHAAILRAIADGDEELAAVLASRHVTQVGIDYVAEAKA